MATVQGNEYRRVMKCVEGAKRDLLTAHRIAQAGGLRLTPTLERLIGSVDSLLAKLSKLAGL
jgi:hypothetical protein